MKEVSEQEWLEICEIFHAAVELSKPDREKFLAEISDERKRAEVEKLLASDADEDTFLQLSPINAINSETKIVKIPEQIGKYKILREIGRGGMGAVYLAAREDFKKQVALKIIKRGMDTDEILRRFQTERQILANLEHSNIARLLDGGVSDDGLPFIVMEYVAGSDLLEFCEQADLSLNEKLALFRKICAAVSYAHQNLIVHRDLKPSNILVTKDGEPKLLDFGISKLLTNEIDATGTATSLGMMTPNYASPEQFRGETVSTATDIYSLGVILFELLTGELPYEIRTKRFEEAAKIIAETEPARPSSVIQNSKFRIQDSKSDDGYRFQTEDSISEDQKSKTKDQNQKTNPKSKIRNPKLLKGDLDNILLKALRKEPVRRYLTVEQFSEDIRRHQTGLPVTARPDTFSYRASKFVKRNKISVASAGLVSLALIGGVIGTSWQAVRAERQRVLAERRFGEVRELANNFVFKYHDGIANLQGSTEMRKMLVTDATKYLDILAQDAANDEQLQIELANAYVKLADVQGKTYYSNIGDTAGAIENYQKAIKILEKLAESTKSAIQTKAKDDLILALQTLGMMQMRVFAHTDSIATQQRAVELVEKKAAIAPEDTDVQYLRVRANGRLADSMREGGRFDEAMQIYRQTLALCEDIFRRAPANENVETAISVFNDRIGRYLTLHAIELKKRGAAKEIYEPLFNQALPHLEKMFAGFEKLAAAHPEKKKYRRDLSTAYGNLGMFYRETGNLEKSRELLEKDLKTRLATAEKDAADRESQADLSDALRELAQTKAAQKEFSSAFTDFERTRAILDKLIAADKNNMEFRRSLFQAENFYGDALLAEGNRPKAAEIYRTAFQKLSKDAPETPYLTFAEGILNENLGNIARAEKDSETARQSFEKTLALWQKPNAAPQNFNYCVETIDYLKQKIAN